LDFLFENKPSGNPESHVNMDLLFLNASFKDQLTCPGGVVWRPPATKGTEAMGCEIESR
jgi:hypothetical protein